MKSSRIPSLSWAPVILALAVHSPARAIEPPSARAERSVASGRLDTQFAEAASLPGVPERVSFWAKRIFDGRTSTPQLRAALGPGALRVDGDNVPLVPESFDCTVFVETVMSLARSSDALSFAESLKAIRYRAGRTGYLARNHFPEADWIPNNVASGAIEESTRALAAKARVPVARVSKIIRKRRWLAERVARAEAPREVASAAAAASEGWEDERVAIDYVPVDQVARLAPSIPDGTVVSLVRPDRAGEPVLITHQGVVVQERGTTWIIHATRNTGLHRQVLATYVRALADEGRGSWPLLGIHLNAVRGRSD